MMGTRLYRTGTKRKAGGLKKEKGPRVAGKAE